MLIVAEYVHHDVDIFNAQYRYLIRIVVFESGKNNRQLYDMLSAILLFPQFLLPLECCRLLGRTHARFPPPSGAISLHTRLYRPRPWNRTISVHSDFLLCPQKLRPVRGRADFRSDSIHKRAWSIDLHACTDTVCTPQILLTLH